MREALVPSLKLPKLYMMMHVYGPSNCEMEAGEKRVHPGVSPDSKWAQTGSPWYSPAHNTLWEIQAF